VNESGFGFGFVGGRRRREEKGEGRGKIRTRQDDNPRPGPAPNKCRAGKRLRKFGEHSKCKQSWKVTLKGQRMTVGEDHAYLSICWFGLRRLWMFWVEC
jgi:hypothetical protein